ncbi:type II CRISPR-associated endonuclease Cas1 [Vagococcus xieshaowenii]|uniref:CRISPR-associated endonuclease Cas1 n=1 Tax=Vagococcus xieshaowenii TaxID=2562451 RepID=A0AAJ5JL17_9ENTE|nr:type II CRISPR-associated endonuclease Cas1 [Vagococcus xieshaowenii]QCA28731.1 type II CRISPR-associated endonuclease Cas1 [Vagococcus xieshaowenii]TFZ40461.1 type II CRISPR-associated endonuclease Cas1 [Vagococcus xieshaowenii]
MTWRVVLIKDSEELKLKLDNLHIICSESDFVIPLSDISMIVIESVRTKITSRLLAKCADYSISVIFCDKNYLPVGVYHPFLSHSRSSKIVQKQAKWTEEMKDNIWKEIISLKIENQKQVLVGYGCDEERIAVLDKLKNEVKLGDSSNREGHAAKVYFNTLFGLEFNRRSDDFIVNGALNYGYTILRSYMARLVTGYGLIPALGVFHKSEYNQFNLVDDLIEPFRPIVDAWTVKYMNGREYLTADDRRALIDLLNQRLVYNGNNTLLSTIMEKYVQKFVNIMIDNKEINLKNFDLLSLESVFK